MFSPGPNIIMLTTSAARFGAPRTVPHFLGVAVGCGFVGALCALGVGALLDSVPGLKFVLQCAAALWIVWMAWNLFRADASGDGALASRPMTFLEAALFQWVNPKIWAIGLAASSGYGSDLPIFQEALRMGLSFSCVNFVVCGFWTYFGSLLARLLNSARAWQIFRTTMAVLLAASAALVFL
ncbi:MAG: LysE family translocator [Pseudomonadota bacterium]